MCIFFFLQRQSHSVAQAGLKSPPTSASQMLGLRARPRCQASGEVFLYRVFGTWAVSVLTLFPQLERVPVSHVPPVSVVNVLVRVSETQQKECQVRTSPPVRTASGLSSAVSSHVGVFV